MGARKGEELRIVLMHPDAPLEPLARQLVQAMVGALRHQPESMPRWRFANSTTHEIGHVAESATHKTRRREVAPDSRDALLAFRVREDDGILAEVMMTEVAVNKPDKPDPVLEHFVELRKYIEHSHDELSKRLEKVEGGLQRLEGRVEGGLQRLEGRQDMVEGGLQRLEGRQDMVEGGLQRLEGRQEMVESSLQRVERKVDAGFDRLARKIDALAPARRAAPRRRKP